MAVVSGLLMAGLFVGDLFTPLGFAHGVLYVPVLVLAATFAPPRALVVLGATAVLLTLLGWMWSPPPPPGVAAKVYVSNRLISMLAVVVTTVIAYWLGKTRAGLEMTRNTAQTMSRLLAMASEVGHLGAWQYSTGTRASTCSIEVFRLHGLSVEHDHALEEVLACYSEQDRQRFKEQLEACARTRTGFEDEFRIASGSRASRWIRVTARAVVHDGGRVRGVEGTFQDISRQKEIELELARSLQRWQSLAETLPVIIWTADQGRQLTYTSRSLADYSGIAAQALLGDGWTAIVHPDDVTHVATGWVPSSGSDVRFESMFRIRRKDGQYRWHLARVTRMKLQGDPEDSWYGTAMDIDARIRLERDVKQAARRYETVLESMTDAIFAMDRNWHVTLMNSHAEVLLDRKKEDLIGKNVWEAFPEAVGTAFQQNYERCMRHAEVVRFEEWYEPLQKHFEVNAYPSAEGISVYFRDMTEQRVLRDQLNQSQKLESIGQLTGGIAHDFNNLLTVIRGNTGLLLDSTHDSGNKPLLQSISDAADRGAIMVRRLLAFARKQELSPAPVDVNRLAQGMHGLLHRTLGEHIEITLALDPAVPPAVVDEVQLESALLNLAINARDAMPEGGCLTIATSTVTPDAPPVHQGSGTPATYVQIEVADTGKGISPRMLSKVFDPFFTTKPKGQGTGLGLAMVHGFIKQSAGHIAIDSAENRGTSIKMLLPVARQEPEVDAVLAPSINTADIPLGQGERVLLVEDDDLVRSYATTVLKKLGYEVVSAADGREALELIRSQPDIAVLFTDVIMPGGMTGPELAAQAREIRPTLPVLFASGYTEDAMTLHDHRFADDLLLTKPYKKADLALKLSQAIHRS